LDGKDNLQKLQMSNSSMLGEVVDGPVQDQIYTLSSSPLSRFLVVISHPSIDNCQCYIFNIQEFANLFSPWVSEAILTCHSSIWLADQHLENKSRILLLKIKWYTVGNPCHTIYRFLYDVEIVILKCPILRLVQYCIAS
jgi:hypothetical protein